MSNRPTTTAARCAMPGGQNGWCDQPRPCPKHDVASAALDRVAEAIYESDRRSAGAAINAGRHAGVPWRDLDRAGRAIYLRNAEAAIKAMEAVNAN